MAVASGVQRVVAAVLVVLGIAACDTTAGDQPDVAPPPSASPTDDPSSGPGDGFPVPADLAILAEEGAALGAGTRVVGGSVVVRTAGSGLDTDGAALTVGPGARVTGPDVWVLADDVRVEPGAEVANLASNAGRVDGVVGGRTVTGLTVPVDVGVPGVAPATAGIDAVQVEPGEERALDSGAYGALVVDGTVTLTGGRYVFDTVTVGSAAVVQWTAPVQVVVTGQASIGSAARVVPEPSAAFTGELPARVAVLGANAVADQATSTPALSVGPEAMVQAGLLAPSGTVALGVGASVTGSVAARWVSVGDQALVWYERTVDAGQAPEVELTGVVDGDTVSGVVDLAVTSEGEAWQRVVFSVDGQVAADVEDGPFAFAWDSTVFSDGEHTVRAVAWTATGATATTSTVTVRVEQPVPEPSDPGMARMLQDYESGLLSEEDFARYGVYRYIDPTQVPEQYRITDDAQTTDPSYGLAAALANVYELDPEVRDELLDLVLPGGAGHEESQPLTEAEIATGFDEVYRAGQVPASVASTLTSRAVAATTDTGASLQATTADVSLSGWVRGVVTCGGTENTLRPLVSTRPVLTCRYATPWADFFYTSAADDPGDGIDVTLDEWDTFLTDANGGNGVPDEIDVLAESFYQATLAYQDLDYPAVPHLSVGVVSAAAASGVAIPRTSLIYVPRATSATFGYSAYVIRHELFHHVQYQYTYPGWWQRVAAEYSGVSDSSTAWWMEATAEWGAHQAQEWAATSGLDSATSTAFAEARSRVDYANHLLDFLDGIADGLTSFVPPTERTGDGIAVEPQYGAFLLAEHLDQKLGTDVIRQTWQAVGTDSPPIAAIERVVADHGTTLQDLVTAFHRANLTITDSYTDPQAAAWVRKLTGGSSRSIPVGVASGQRATGSTTIGAGGAVYLTGEQIPVDGDAEGALVAVSLVAIGDEAGSMRARAVRLDSDGQACSTLEGDGFALTGSGRRLTTQVPVTTDCGTVVVVVTNPDATAGRSKQDTGRLQVSYDLRYRAAGDGPLDVGLVLDPHLGSSAEADRQRAAAHALVDSLRPGDRVTVTDNQSWGPVRLSLSDDLAQVHATIDEAYQPMSRVVYLSLGAAMDRLTTELTRAGNLDHTRARTVVAFGDRGAWAHPGPEVTTTMNLLGIRATIVGWQPLDLEEQIIEIADDTGGFALILAPDETPDQDLMTIVEWQRWVVVA